MTTIEFPRRDEEPEQAPITLAQLREQTRALADELPGTLRKITLRAGGLSVAVEWEGAPAVQQYVPAPYAQPAPEQAAVQAPAPEKPVEKAENTNTIPVTAPLVGTFYRSPSPTAEAFVKLGDLVEPGQPLAIIEAMKLLNNITSEHRAKVVAIHVDNGDIVEYGQPLLDLEPVD